MNDSKRTTKDSDYQSFLDDQSMNTNVKLDNLILNKIKKDLSPSHASVFTKLLAVQAFIGFLTLSFCPQFKLSLTSNFELFHFFHNTFGENICMSICGAIFIGSGSVFASYIMGFGEINKIKESKFLYYTSLSVVFTGAFFVFGASFYLKSLVFWFLGAIFSGIFLLDLNFYFRKFLLRIHP